jgi:hypothetical protein
MSDETIKEVLETLDIEPVAQTPAPETPPVTPEVPAVPPVAAVPDAPVVPASPPAPVTPAAPVEPPAADFTGEPASPVVPAAVPAAVVPDPRDAELEAFRAQVMELSKRLAAVPQQPPPAAPIPAPLAPSAQVIPITPVAPAAPAASEDIIFFKDEAEVDAALKDAGSFNKFLNNFLRQVEPVITQKAVFKAAQMIPEVSMNVANDQIAMLSTVKAWYDDNPDLLPFKEFCGMIAKDITAKDPTITMSKALAETEKEVRSRLRIVKPTNTAPVTPSGAPLGSPGFTPGGGAGGGGAAPVLDKVQKDILTTILD